jgi:hypothetical protein
MVASSVSARTLRRLAGDAVVLVLAIVLAGCGETSPSIPPDESIGPIPTLLPVGDVGPQTPRPTSDAAGMRISGLDEATSTHLMGAFRRSSVRVSPALEGTFAEACRSRPTPPHVEEIGMRPVVVTDMRGEGVVIVVFADDEGASGCRVTVGADGSLHVGFFPVTEDPSKALEEDDLTLGAMEYQEDGTSQRAIAVGRAGDRAVHVRAGFDDDTYVTATLRDDWYAMWWPGLTRAAVIVAADNRNVAIGTVTPEGR